MDDGRAMDACLYYKLTYEPLAVRDLTISTTALSDEKDKLVTESWKDRDKNIKALY